jgi:LuxR family transcriptional regulator, maltose regulon positive regulatory protein
MSSLLLSTKLQAPQIRLERVPRLRLVERLQQGLAHKLILISAPAGYGKTTLLCEWLATCGKSSAWISLDKEDNDPPRFWSYFRAALQRSISLTGNTLPDFFPEHDPLLGKVWLTSLINELDKLQQPLILVLDDYHNINTGSIHEGLSFVLDHAPAHFYLVISTRADPPLPLASLRARSQMMEIRQFDLTFTSQEAADFLHHTMGLAISQEDVASITARTEGWIAGLQMAALSMQNMDDIPGFISALSGSHHYIFDYLLEEILKRQSPEIHRFLLYTSIVDQLTAPLCDVLVDEGPGLPRTRSSAAILEELEHANLFILPLDHEQRWYRYHHLFSDLLRLILEKADPGRAVELHRRACRWYEAQGMISEALDHALSSGDMELVAQIVSANALLLVENDATASTLRKIDLLPLDQVTALPWLGIARGWILVAGQVHKSEQLLDAVEKSLDAVSEERERQRMKGHIAAARAHLLGTKGARSQAAEQARLALELIPEDEIAIRARTLTVLGDMISYENISAQGLPFLEQAWRLALQAKKPHVAMIAAASLANVYLFQGRMRALERVCREALAIAQDYERDVQQPLPAASTVYALLARVFAEWGENEIAIQYAQTGITLSKRWGQDTNEEFCLDYMTRALIFSNHWEEARPLLERSNIVAWKISPAMGLERAIFTLDSLLDCDMPLSKEIQQQIERIQNQGAQIPTLQAARVLLRENKPDQALIALERAQSELIDEPFFDIVRIHALTALAYEALGKQKLALASLKQALDLGEPENRVATFVREGAAMEKLLRLAKFKGLSPGFIQRLLAAFDARQTHKQNPERVAKELVEMLSTREMEVLTLLAEGCSDKDIAERLFISRGTVHKHLKNIYGKLGVHSRTEALVQAHKLELL